MLDKTLKDRYKIIRELGAGGFGKTYLAADTQRPGQPQCVVKQLMPVCEDSEFLQVARRLFHVEAEILEKLGHHDQIPQLLAYFEEDKEFYLVEEFIPGPALSEELFLRRKLSEAEVIDILRGILQTLLFVHQQGVIHRDIKPSNIIRRQADHQLVLIDFGSVKQIQPQVVKAQDGNLALTTLTIAIGTGGYAPLEQLAGQPRFNSDIYALGIVAVQCLTGISPKQLKQDPASGKILWRTLAEVEEPLAAILDKMIHCLWTDRYQSAADVLQDLAALGHFSPVSPTLVDPPSMIQATIVTPASPSTPFSEQDCAHLKEILMDLVGPIGALIFQQAVQRSTNLTELLANLSAHLPRNQLSEFTSRARAYLQGVSIQPQTAPPTLPETIAETILPAVSDAFIQQCQDLLIEMVGPIANLLIQKVLRSQPRLSPVEMIRVLSAEIPDKKKAAEFCRRLENWY